MDRLRRHRAHCTFIVVLLVTLPILVSVPAYAAFGDVSTHWARPYIDRASARGFITGYDDGTFRPDRPITRLEAIVMLVRLMGLESQARTRTSIPATFRNPGLVPDWAKGYVALAVERGLLAGDDLVAFNGPLVATRADVAVWLARALGLEDAARAAAGAVLEFTDAAAIPPSARGYVHVLQQRGLMSGFDDGSFRPVNAVTRAQMATLLARADRLSPMVTGNLVRGTVQSVDLYDRALTVRTAGGATEVLTVAATASLYSTAGSVLLLSELPVDSQVEAVKNDVGMVVYLEVVTPGDSPGGGFTGPGQSGTSPGTAPGTDDDSGAASDRHGYVFDVSLSAGGAVRVITDDARLVTYPLADELAVTRNGTAVSRSALEPGVEIRYRLQGGRITAIDLRGAVTLRSGRVARVSETGQYRVLLFDIVDEDGDRESTHVFVGSGVPITREGAPAALRDLRSGDWVVVRQQGDQARSITALAWRKEYAGTVEALAFGPGPRLRLRTGDGLVELPFPDDPDDADLWAVDPDDEDERRIELFDLQVGDRVRVVTEGSVIAEVTVEEVEVTTRGTVRSITIAEDVRLVLQSADGGAEQTYRVAPDVEVEAGDARVSLLDVRTGIPVELVLRGGEVRRIRLDAVEVLTEFRGRVVFLGEDVAVVEPDEGAGSYRLVMLAEDGLVLRFNTSSRRIDALQVGDIVRVIGNQRGDRFQATSIIVLGTR